MIRKERNRASKFGEKTQEEITDLKMKYKIMSN